MNPIPDYLKTMIMCDSNTIKQLRSDSVQLDLDKRIWTYPKL